MEELKENMSEELKEKILLERIDAAKETLLSNMNDAEKDMEELERNLMKYVQKMCFFFFQVESVNCVTIIVHYNSCNYR